MNKIVKIIGITALAALLFTACSGTTGAMPAASSSPAQLSVTGIGQVLVVPDIAFISVGVRTQDVAVSEAIAANNTQAQQIKDTLIAEGVSESDIQTSSFYVYQNYNYDFQGIQTDYYYVVENTVYVTVRDIGNMGGILDAVGRSGANNIYGVTFDVADKTAAQSTARELAVQAAKAQAEELASAAGVELGELLSITSFSTTTMQDFSGYGMGGGGAASVPISSGEMPINAEVNLTYAIK